MSSTSLPRLPAGLPAVVDARLLSGWEVGRVWAAELRDGRWVVVKATAYDARLEAEGLDALRAAGGPTPEVLGVAPHVLVLAHVGGGRHRDADADAEELGAAVATVHRQLGPSFGWRRDNVIGPLPQDNTPTDAWVPFYVERRLRPYLGDLPDELADRLRAAFDGPLPDLLDHEVAPSLVHGDLWSGNVVAGRWLIDPAVHHGDRELDLAMLELFGGVSEPLARGYASVWPLDEGWERRRPALQLYHLLVHVRLFGSSYLRGVASRLDTLGW